MRVTHICPLLLTPPVSPLWGTWHTLYVSLATSPLRPAGGAAGEEPCVLGVSGSQSSLPKTPAGNAAICISAAPENSWGEWGGLGRGGVGEGLRRLCRCRVQVMSRGAGGRFKQVLVGR